MSTRRVATNEEVNTMSLPLSWRGLLRLSAIGELIVLLLTMVILHDVLAAGLALILLVGLMLLILRGRLFGLMLSPIARVVVLRQPEERVGALILGLLFADIGFYTLTGAATNFLNGASGVAIVLPASLAAFAVTGFVAAVICVFRPAHSTAPTRGALNLAVGGLIVYCVVLGIGVLSRGQVSQVAAPSDITLVTEDIAYSKPALTSPPGQIVVELDNHDLFWHTFTIDALGVDLKVPMQSKQRVQFSATPGVYRFHCTIPGHELLGMTGTLTVR